MAVETGTVTGHLELLAAFRRFICGLATYSDPVLTGTGDGTLAVDGTYPTTVTENWTITCTDATTPGAEVWSVTGSVSGAQASATTGVAYDSGEVMFTITAGATNFIVTDEFTFSTTQGVLTAEGQAWVEMDSDATTLMLKGLGLAGTEEIYANLMTGEDEGADYYYWALEGATAYDSGFAWGDQPGDSPTVYMHLSNLPMNYWFIANGRRFIVVAKVSTTYQSLYAGFILPYFTPGEMPYPLYIAGNTGTPANRWSSESANDSNFWNPGDNTAYFREVDGTWTEVTNHYSSGGVWTWRYTSTTGMFPWLDTNVSPDPQSIRDNRDGTYALFPSTMVCRGTPNHLFGALDGVFWVSGFNNVSENTITVGGDTYVVIQDMNRTGRNDYAALLLE